MPREPQDLASLLLVKAATDLSIVRTLIKADEPYEAVGFHAQQACEKAAKAVLAAVGVGFPHTHNLALLVDLLTSEGVDVPERIEDIVMLTPFAVLFRYADFDLDEEPISLPDMVVLVEHVHRWASEIVGPGSAA